MAENPDIRDFKGIGKNFLQPCGKSFGLAGSFYRPFTIFSYAIDYSFWGLKPTGYHLTNVFLHISVALLFFWLLQILFKNLLCSVIASLLFLTHPIQSEAVSYISNRADLLVAFLILTAFIFYINQNLRHRRLYYIFSIFSYFLALLTKENSVVLLGLIILYHISFKRKVRWVHFLPFIIITLFYVMVRTFIIGPQGSLSAGMISRLPGFFIAIALYARILLTPFNLHMEYGRFLFLWDHPRALLGLGLFITTLLFALTQKNKNSPVFFSILWFYLTLIPVSNLFFQLPFFASEHYLYVPVMGVFILIGYVISLCYRKYKVKIFTQTAIVFLVASCMYLTVKQNNYWLDPIPFYYRTLSFSPFSGRIWQLLGYEYEKNGEFAMARICFDKAVLLNKYPNLSPLK